ncbi:MAG TPA: ThuA domain-containing protein [Acidobacteriaceae bacterium]|jgi:type 1 glutamine amidotransferase|nr:ThuA domain-containing protein [Acidobacteriaceae bacterium]
MMRKLPAIFAVAVLALSSAITFGQQARFHVLAFYSTNVEGDHVDFAKMAIPFFEAAARKDNFEFKTTTNWDDLNATVLKQYQVILWLDDFPHTAAQRAGFQHYMEHGGAWLGFHIAAFNDDGTHWPWFVKFLGGAVFYGNSWPPLPATLTVDDTMHPVTQGIPASFVSPANEWYSWKPDPRADKNVKVLLTFAPSNYPLGFKDTLTGGDIPAVWTNTKYKMVYMNMGHGAKIFTSPVQNRLFMNALLWLGGRS